MYHTNKACSTAVRCSQADKAFSEDRFRTYPALLSIYAAVSVGNGPSTSGVFFPFDLGAYNSGCVVRDVCELCRATDELSDDTEWRPSDV